MNADAPDFDEDSRPTASIGFQYPNDETETPCDHSQAALEVLRQGLIVCVAGHRDATRARVFALMTLAGLYQTPSDAAKAARAAPSTITRAIHRLQKELAASLRKDETPAKPNDDRPNDGPS